MKIQIVGNFTIYGLKCLNVVRQPLKSIELEVVESIPVKVNNLESIK